MKRFSVYILICVILLSACSQKGKTADNSSSTKTIVKLAHCWSQRDVIDVIAKKYQEVNPEIIVDVEYIPVEQYMNTLMNRSLAGELPDLFMGWPGSSMEWFYENNLVEDLSHEKWVQQIDETMIDEVTYEETIRMFPLNKTFICFCYNKDLFEELNIEIPKDYDDFIKICELLKKHNKLPIALGSRDSSGYIYTTWMMLASEIYAYNQSYDEQLFTGQEKMSSEKWYTILKRQNDWITNGYVNSNHLAIDRMSSSLDTFIKGDAAMFIFGSWELNSIYDRMENLDTSFELGFFPMPSTNDSGILVCASGEGLCVNKDSKVKQEAMKVLSFFANDEINSLLNTSMNSFTSLKDKTIEYNLKLSVISKYISDQKIWGYPDAAWPRSVGDKLALLFPKYLAGIIDEKEFMSEMDKLWGEERKYKHNANN